MSVFSTIPAVGGGGASVDLSGITAGSSQILGGYQSIDSNGNVVYGSIYPENTEPVFADGIELLPMPEMVEIAIPAEGYYSGSGFGLWVSYSDLAQAIGLTASKLKTGVTVLGITGT